MEIVTVHNGYKLFFRYHPSIISKIKATFPKESRRFNGGDKSWFVHKDQRELLEEFARKNRFRWANGKKDPEKVYDIPPMPKLALEIPILGKLRHYQEEGVAYNLQRKKVILGDDMGLGKTLQAIATILGFDKLHQEGKAGPAFPCLVICPSSVKYNWQLQWEKWTGKKYAMILDNSIKSNYHLYLEANMAKVFIVNYESLKKYFVRSIFKKDGKNFKLKDITFDGRINLFNTVIVDEIHKVKDVTIQQAKFVKGITIDKNYIFGLTGTPVINKPIDLVSELSIIGQLKKFGGYSGFKNRYCQGKKKASNLKELNYMLNKHCFYRRSKQEVAKELPPKSRQVIVSEISTLKEYNDAEKDLVNYLRQYKDASDEKIQSAVRGQVMVQIGVLKNISARGKIKSVIDFVNDTIEQGEKIVLFVHLREVAAMLKEKYKNAATILGSDKLEERQASIKRFQEEKKCNVMIASLKAAGTGVDGLQNASCMVAFVELGWTAADHDQAEDRLNRIGQKRSVNCFYFLGKNTIDTHIYQIIQTKRGIADTVTGNTDEVKTDFVNEFANLFNK